METTQMSINWWINKQNVVYPYNGILLIHKKEWGTDILKGESWKDCAKWQKPDTKGHILGQSYSCEMSQTGKPLATESILVVVRGWGMGVPFGALKIQN